MIFYLKNFLILALFLGSANAMASEHGTLFLAHGSMQGCGHENPTEWEKYVIDMVNEVKSQTNQNVEVAFGMWNTKCFQEGVETLNQKSSTGQLAHLRVVPIFISSHSLVIEMQKYIFKLREDKPIPLPMVHQINFNGEIDYQKGIDYSPFVSLILSNRAHELIHAAKERGFDHDRQDLVIVMHGPSMDKDNPAWLEMAQKYADDVNYLFPFANIKIISLRDDAAPEIRDAATKELQDSVDKSTSEGRIALVLPLLISKGGIDEGILERLGSRNYIWKGNMLAPDPIFAKYLLSRIQQD